LGASSASSQDPGNWDLGRTPTAEDSLEFNGAVSSANCNLEGGWTYESVRVANGYAGTVTLLEGFNADVFVLDSKNGKISQPTESGSNIYVWESFTWTAGVLNSSDNHSYVVLSGAIATITPPSDTTLVTGSTLSFGSVGTTGSDGTFNPGTIQFNNGADLDVGALSKVLINPTATVPVKFQNPNPGTSSQVNVVGGLVVVATNTFNGENTPVNVVGGVFKVLDKAAITVTGRVGGAADAGSIEMSSGNIAIQHPCTVTAGDNGMVLSGGVLTTLKYGEGA
jgi:hypothetical protein